MGDEVAIREPLDQSTPKMSGRHMIGERYKSYMRRPLLIVCGFIILVLLIIIIILAALLARTPDTESSMKDSICQEEHCIRTASRLLGAMKTDVDPCDNFYEFACGQWVDKHRVPEDKGSIDTMEEVSDRLERDLQDLLETKEQNDIDPIKKAKQYYKACMDTEAVSSQGMNKMLAYISDLGGWPVLDENWDGQLYDLEARIAQARQYITNFVWPIPSSIIVGLNILNDYKTYGKHVIYFDQPSLLMEGRDMYQDAQLKRAYYKYTTDVAVALGADPNVAKTQMKELVDFEVELAGITIAVSERRDMEGNYRRMNVSQLSSIYPTFDWLRYMQAVFKDAGVTITNEESVVLWMKPYFDKLFPLLKKTPNRIIANYVVWRLLTEQLISLDEKFSLMNLEFRKVSEGVKQLKTRSLRCSENTNQFLAHATGRMYAEKIFGPKEREHMLELISYLRRIFKNIVNTANWMDDVTKSQALEKLETMKSMIGFPSFIFNDTILSDLYKNVSISTSDFFGNLQTIRRYVSLQQLAELRKPSYERWPERPAVVNAYYHSGLNAIVFPAGILQSPYYDINYPASINFGGIGLVIGHEITHGYDASGRAFDAKGLLHNWWSDFSMENFNKKAECVVKHYSEFEVPNIGMNINGNNTLSENIADIGGIKQSHLAYKLWLKEHGNNDIRLPGLTGYTNEQLFFINTAQLWCSKFTDEAARRSVLTSEHSLPMFRVLGELRNSYGFSEAFQCPIGSYMNPTKDKCSIW